MNTIPSAILLIAALATPTGSISGEVIQGVATVVDADTIEIHGKRIRLNAVDAIEAQQRCARPDGSQWNCGKDAAFALADKIGRSVIACRVVDVDRYSRSVAICATSDDEDLGGWLVESGWALAYRRYGPQYVDAEARAKAAGLGIWQSTFVLPWDWRKGLR
ncbi:thermonuclease family protein [Gemmobacter denitrificans]|uniref:Thermonuclease family protein n=1 Tax=Gemmobacter denitrificans TaxID=3123040 RepID=A0ABU8C063_9RHOB